MTDGAVTATDDVYVFPASAAQRRLWFTDRLQGGAYAIAGGLRLSGPLDAERLERAFDTLVGRHEALRTRFAELDGEVVQVVEPEGTVTLAVTDLCELDVDEREAVAMRLAVERAREPFDLRRTPLLRAQLLRLDTREHLLVVCLHHAVADGWSVGVLVRELAAAYGGRTLPELHLQFGDVAIWERELGDDGVRYWARELRGVPALRLPADGSRLAPPGAGERVTVDLPERVADGLDALARAAGATPFVAWLAAYAAVLSRWTGQHDFAIGVPVANRDRAELQQVVGCLVNVVALRMDLSGAPGLRELIERVARRTAAGRAHWAAPFERVVEAVEADREPGRHPLFSVLLDHQPAVSWPASEGGELALRDVAIDLGTSKFDLTLEVGTGGCVLEYASERFSRESARLMAQQLSAFFGAAVAEPERPLADFELGDGPRIARWNATDVEFPGAPTLHGLIEQQAERTPTAVAAVCGADALSFRELEERAARLAGWLARAGVGTGAVVGVRLERSLELVVALLGVLKAGAAYLPLDPELPAARLAWMAEDAGAALVLEPGSGGEADAVPASAAGDSVAYVIYTSGSTGRPKGVMVTHTAIRNRLLWMQAAFGLNPGEGVVQKTPIGFDVSVWELFWPLIAGGRLVLAAPGGHRDPAYLARLIEEQAVTTAHFVPSMLEAFVACADAAACRSLRRVIASGESLPAPLVERFHALGLDAELHNLYGPTEAAVDVTAWHCRRDEPRDQIPIGRPIANVRMHVVDEGGRQAPVGAIGELCIAGVQVARGYLGRPGLTAERFVPDPFSGEAGARMYRTGDRARWCADGALEFHGRLDGQVKVRGHRIELGEVDATLRRHPNVREAVTVVRGEGDRRALHAYVTGSADVDPGALRDALRAELPEAMVPATITHLQAFPTTANGKLDRRALPVPGARAPEPAQPPPRGATESALAAIFAELLEVPRVSRSDDFFALGGHSLLTLRLLARVSERLGTELEPGDVFEAPVLARLAERIERTRRGRQPISRADRTGRVPLSPAQERIWLMHELDRGSAAYNLSGAVRLRGALDRERLTAALDVVESRHEALRTTIVAGPDGVPAQVVAPPAGLAPALEDLSDLDQRRREEEAARLARAEARRPFDLLRGPLVRWRLVRLGVDDHVLVLCLHHVIADGWSVGLIIEELAMLYSGATPREPSLQPGDVALWERELEDADGLEYWARALERLPALSLPAAASDATGHAGARLPAELRAAVEALARESGVTPFVVWLAGFAWALARLSGQRDFGIGVPFANRERPELARVVGCLLNVVVVRADLTGDPSFLELIRRIGRFVADGRRHWRVPFERVVQTVARSREPGRHPLFQVLFDYQGGPDWPDAAGDLTLSGVPADTGASQFELALYLRELDDGAAEATLTSATDGHGGAFVDRFHSLLEEAVAHPDRPLATPRRTTEPPRAEAVQPSASTRPAATEPPSTRTQLAIAAAWREILELPADSPVDVNFFDAGGNSLLLVRVRAVLERTLGRRLELVDLFSHPTVAALAAHLDGTAAEKGEPWRDARAATAEPIAIVGLAGRFPGARDVEELWQNLCDGVESISFFTAQELAAAGVDPALADHDRYVAAGGVLEDIEGFDAGLFGYSAAEADALDPQGRLLLECAWEALEDAACDPARFPGRVGVYAGATLSTYMLGLLRSGPGSEDTRRLLLAGDKDYVATRLSYKLGLTGPSVSVQTACSTSLVAVQMACESLRSGQCELALAGGVSVTIPQRVGHWFQEGGIESPDGHCRAFDARAAGTIGGNGVALVVLKPLERALDDGDSIRAVIRGAAVNNDGAVKVGFTAPSVEGQAAVIAAAQDQAGVTPESIGYVEAHGTGTALGDAVEITALTQAFRRHGAVPAGACAIGSVKTNLGHLDAAAGVTGLLKAALAVERGVVPPSLHCEEPNHALAGSPFVVAAEARRWEPAAGPRRAGVSSFGLGGTNAHVVLEEPPEPAPASMPAGPQLLVLSARSAPALDAAGARLADALEAQPDLSVADAAYTLQTGRRRLRHRRAVVCADAGEAVEALRAAEAGAGRADEAPAVAFLFPGQGAQAPGMAAELYDGLPRFRRHADECLALLHGGLADTLARLVFALPDDEDDAAARLTRTALAQPALFIVEHALAQVWMEWGVRPAALIGHSLGELVAACVSGVLGLEDALTLVTARGRLMDAAPPGAMLAVHLAPAELEPLLPDGVSIAAVNATALTVAAGASEAVDRLAAMLDARGTSGSRLQTSRAFHSEAMDSVVAPFREAVAGVSLSAPRIPLVSNVTGDWLAPALATDPDYWAQQLRRPVQLARGLQTVLAAPAPALLEVGPGRTLATLARANGAAGEVLVSGTRPRDALQALGSLWAAGLEADWDAVADGRRRRVTLPTYPFERRRHWLDGVPAFAPRAEAELSVTSWTRAGRAGRVPASLSGSWLVLAAPGSPIAELARRMAAIGAEVTHVLPGTEFARREPGTYTADPCSAADLERVLAALGRPPDVAVHGFEDGTHGFWSACALVRALAARAPDTRVELVSAGAYDVIGTEPLQPTATMLQALTLVAPQELPGLSCRLVDAGPGELDALIAELAASPADRVVALRSGWRWRPEQRPLPPVASPAADTFRESGVYLVTGGLGKIGLALAEHLARRHGARLVLTGRRGLADASARVAALEATGTEVLVEAVDVTDLRMVRALAGRITERFGCLDGVVHAAGVAGDEASRELLVLDAAAGDEVMRAKVIGLETLQAGLEEIAPETWILCSSLSSVLGGLGFGAYAAANLYLDAVATRESRAGAARWISVQWDGWRFDDDPPTADERLRPATAVEQLERIGASRVTGPVAVAASPLDERLERWVRRIGEPPSGPALRHARPALSAAYRAPASGYEQEVARVWEQLLGLERVGADDDFFELGGHSLLATQIVSRLRQSTGLPLTLRAALEGPTVARQAAALSGLAWAARGAPGADPAAEARETGEL